MRKAGGAIAIALEPNNAPASMQSQHRVSDLQHRVSHPMTDEKDHRAQGSTLQTSAEKELQLIERAKQDPRAFAPLYNTYADMVWRFAMSRLRNPERASDVTSQTFVKAIQSLPRFQPKLVASGPAPDGKGTSFPAWLMMITRNTVIDEQRKHRPTADIEDPVYATDMATTSTPESIAITRDEQRRVRQAISKLSPKQQRMVELRIAGYSGKEIAEIMGMTLNGVRTAHSRAYSKLRDLLADDI